MTVAIFCFAFVALAFGWMAWSIWLSPEARETWRVTSIIRQPGYGKLTAMTIISSRGTVATYHTEEGIIWYGNAGQLDYHMDRFLSRLHDTYLMRARIKEEFAE